MFIEEKQFDIVAKLLDQMAGHAEGTDNLMKQELDEMCSLFEALEFSGSFDERFETCTNLKEYTK